MFKSATLAYFLRVWNSMQFMPDAQIIWRFPLHCQIFCQCSVMRSIWPILVSGIRSACATPIPYRHRDAATAHGDHCGHRAQIDRPL